MAAASSAPAEPNDLTELLRFAVVEVGELGTAFLVDKDAALTCAHLFAGPDRDGWREPPQRIALRWRNVSGSAKVSCLRTQETPHLPDLALLEDIHWEAGPTGLLTAVMLEDIWTEGEHYFAYGHPAGRFPAEGLVFKYNGAFAFDSLGPKFISLSGDLIAPRGFSGSPILNRKTGKVCGLLAVTVNMGTPEGVRAVPISYAFTHFAGLNERQRRFHQAVARWGNLLPNAAVWRAVESACSDMEESIRRIYPACNDSYYQSRAIEKDIREFVESSARGMIIVGDSGMGKTTLLGRLLSDYRDHGFVCAMFQSKSIPTGSGEVEPDLTNRLGRAKLKGQTLTVEEFWAAIDMEGERRNRKVLVFVDAINEFNSSGYNPAPIRLLYQLDDMIKGLDAKFGRVKFVLTCRPETWKGATQDQDTARFLQKGIYFRPNEKQIAWTLPRFSLDEFEGAYEKYRAAGEIKTPFGELSELARYHLRDPFLLKLAESAYRGKEIPRDLDTGDLFDSYFGHLDEDAAVLANYRAVLDEIVSEMFVGDPGGVAIQRISISRDSDLASRRPTLYFRLDFADRLSVGAKLRDKGVIKDFQQLMEGGDQHVTQIRFNYDRFAEYLLSNRLIKVIRNRRKEGTPFPEVVKDVVEKNLLQSQRTPIVYATLQRTLFLLKEEGKTYVEILRAVSEIDARGQWLVISVLARTARNSVNGVEVLKDLLKRLGKGKSSGGKKFPLIDSVYRVLRDDDYRLWLDEHEDLRGEHLEVLYGHFLDTFRKADAAASAAAVQYLFFLWKSSSRHAFGDAKAITARIVGSIKPPLQTAISSKRRREFLNVGSLLVLVLSEAPEDRFLEAAGLSGSGVRNLKLKRFRWLIGLFVESMLLRFFLAMLKQLPNPVQLDSLENFFDNQETELPLFEEIITLLDPACDRNRMSLANLKRLSQTNNGFVVQMLTFACSAHYERGATAEERTKALALIHDLFYEPPRTQVADYCASLATYHINYFGRFATADSMQLMAQMADSLLSERQGQVTISGKTHTTNIIGTYGRALHKNGYSPGDSDVPNRTAMHYALTALQAAKLQNNPKFYQFVCSELGLLGVLVEPKYLFEVFTAILGDIQNWEERGTRNVLPFSSAEIAESKETILQSLANIRVLYRQQVDKYLLEGLENPELYGDIANKRDPDFRLSFFLSWAFEQLMFRCLVYYYNEIGDEILQSFLDSARRNSATECVRTVVTRLVKRFAEIA